MTVHAVIDSDGSLLGTTRMLLYNANMSTFTSGVTTLRVITMQQYTIHLPEKSAWRSVMTVISRSILRALALRGGGDCCYSSGRCCRRMA